MQFINEMERSYQISDGVNVRSLHERSSEFSFPDLESPLYLARTVIEENGEIVGFGCLKLTSEAIIIIDPKKPMRLRARVLEDLIRTGIFQSQKLGLSEMHAFLTGSNQESFEQTLKKNFGFVGHSGNVLVLNV